MALFELDDIFGYQQANDIKRLCASDSPPAAPGTGEVWLDTLNGNALKRWNGTDWEQINIEISSALTGTAGAHANHPVLKLTQTADTTYNIGDTHSEIQFNTNDPGGTFPGTQAYIRAITTRGNAVSNPDVGLAVGTTDIDGNLVERMVITGEGKVGIGTAAPTYEMEVSRSGENVRIVADRSDGAFSMLAGTDAGCFVGTMNNFDLRLFTNDLTKMIVTKTGEVGINTTTPAKLLDVNGDANISGDLTAGQMVLPTSQPASLVNGSIWIS